MSNHHLFVADLKASIEGEVLTDEVSLGLYSTDASLYQIKPVAVVTPSTPLKMNQTNFKSISSEA